MKQYLDLLRIVRDTGTVQQNRTGVPSRMIPGAMMQFDLTQGFSAITTKKLAWKAVVGELLCFLKGYSSADKFREYGCKIWDQNANENEAWLANKWRKGEDDLGYMYSRLWCDMPVGVERDDTPWNQIDRLVDGILKDPTSRRHIVSAWHPEVFDRAALPPCHVLFQVILDQGAGVLHMTMYQRSCDLFLGVPFNVASYSLLLEMIAAVTGYRAGTFTWFGADVHIYENHLEQVDVQLERAPLAPPKLVITTDSVSRLSDFEPHHIQLLDYQCHEAIKAPMAV